MFHPRRKEFVGRYLEMELRSDHDHRLVLLPAMVFHRLLRRGPLLQGDRLLKVRQAVFQQAPEEGPMLGACLAQPSRLPGAYLKEAAARQYLEDSALRCGSHPLLRPFWMDCLWLKERVSLRREWTLHIRQLVLIRRQPRQERCRHQTGCLRDTMEVCQLRHRIYREVGE